MYRRDFLKLASLASVSLIGTPSLSAPGRGGRQKALVLIELSGGNDGLNTIIPFNDPRYYKLRPNIAIKREQALQISDSLALHPALEPLLKRWNQQDLAIINGVGYPNPNRSHFRSIEIWETASNSDQTLTDGWLPAARSKKKRASDTADGIVVGDNDAGPLSGGNSRAILMNNPKQFIRQARFVKDTSRPTSNSALRHILNVQRHLIDAADDLESRLSRAPSLGASFPRTKIGRKLEVVAQLILAGVDVPVFKISHGSFDTHARQQQAHHRLLSEMAVALAAFHTALDAAERWDDVLISTYSEFGRRAAENGSRGTDHGTAAPHLMLGGNVKGGIFGQQPSLDDLKGGDLNHHVDFRRMYATISRDWWGARPKNLGQFKSIPCLNPSA